MDQTKAIAAQRNAIIGVALHMSSKNTIGNAITAPASHVPFFIPVKTAMQSLPFGDLRWENFERLCYRLAGKEADIESHSLYGRSGQAQQGIDIFARKRNSRYNTWQAKCYKKYSDNDLKKATSTFLKGDWAPKTDVFFIAVQCPVDDVNLQNAIEEQAAHFFTKGITLKVLGGHDLCTALRNHPDIVLEFFGRECAKHFFGDTVSDDILLRLDGVELEKVRAQLQRVYQAGFELLDRIPVNAPTPFSDQRHDPISLLERFSAPDVLLRESIVTHVSQKQDGVPTVASHEAQPADTPAMAIKEEGRKTEQYRRTPISNWLAESNKVAVIGNAGSGKSTVLRCLALDLLGDQQRFPGVAKKWGLHLPLFISFAKWVRLTEANVGIVGIKELLRASWQQQLTADLVALIDKAIDESRVVLFIDGLDEWANEQAARTTLQAMLTIVSAHNIPVVVSARPRGLFKIGGIPDDWAVGLLAPLSKLQQREIAVTWFSRNVSANKGYESNEDSGIWQANRFFKELDKGRGLATLAETPLLLLGLIALAVRHLVLPINKVQALSQLTELLLELHPRSRATAAGDVNSRFSAAASIDVRREALAALAFEIRTEGGDAGYPIQSARQCIRTFLADPDGFCYTPRDASEVANEILAVNSETMGLLVEKGPEEVGFVHASLEEYLASVHIHGWPIDRILSFVRAHASNIRWRSVFGDLIARNKRRSEAEQIVRVIDEPESDAVGALQRRLLLADVVFGGAEITKPTAIRLADRSLEIIAGAGWIGERSAHLSAAFEGIYNPTLTDNVSSSIISWGIRRAEYLQDFYRVLSQCPQSNEQLYILKHGLMDDNALNSHVAAQSLAMVYQGNAEVEKWLVSLLHSDTDLPVVAVALEALATGWPKSLVLSGAITSLANAKDKVLQLSAIGCKIKLSIHAEEDLNALLNLLDWSDGVGYEYKGWAGQCLVEGWSNRDDIVKICLEAASGHFGVEDLIERDAAHNYLISCDASNALVCDWIVSELKSEHPFTHQLGRDWGRLLRFAYASQDVREQLVLAVISKKTEHQEYLARPIYANIEDVRIKQHLINKVRSSEGFSVFWALAPLVEGWAAKDSDVQDLIREVCEWPDERKSHLIALYPKMLNRESCISELLRIISDNIKVRSDLLVSAFDQLDIKDDQETISIVVERVLSEPESAFSGANGLVALFPDNPRVKEYALSKFDERNAPLALLASAYRNDHEVQGRIAKYVGSLTMMLRQQIVESASNEFDRNDTAKYILQRYDLEVDGTLKIQGAIKNYQALFSTDSNRQKVVDSLLSDVLAVGHDHDDRRAAAFAGLITYGATDQFAPLKWGKEPLDISLGSYERESQPLLRLIAENWESLDKSFDGSFVSRLNRFSSEPHFWSIISPHISNSPALRHGFIDYCENSKECLDAQALQALAKELPKSDLLLRHCLSSIKIPQHPHGVSLWARYQSYFEASYILRDHFGGDVGLANKLSIMLQENEFKMGVATLAIYDPHNASLENIVSELLSDIDFSGNYVVPIIVAASRFESKPLEAITSRMINRPTHSLWDFQDRINYALKARMGRDENFTKLLIASLASNPTDSEISSFSRYLASTGKLNEETQKLCQKLLNEKSGISGVPAHGFDAISDSMRPVVHSLLDVLAGPIQ